MKNLNKARKREITPKPFARHSFSDGWMATANKILLTIFLFTSFLQNQNLVCMEGPIEAWAPTESSNDNLKLAKKINDATSSLEALTLSNPDYFAKLPDDLIKQIIYDLIFKMFDLDNKNLSISDDDFNNALILSKINHRFSNLLESLIEPLIHKLTFKVLDPDNRDLSIRNALSNAYKLSKLNARFRDLLKPLIDEINLFYNTFANYIDPIKTSDYDLLDILNIKIKPVSQNFQILAHNIFSELYEVLLIPHLALFFIMPYHPDIFKILLQRGLNPNLTCYSIFNKTKKASLIHIAAEQDKTGESTALLLKYGADPNIKDNKNKTPLERAINPSIVAYPVDINIKNIKLLLEYGADPTKALYDCTHRLNEFSDNPNYPHYERDWYLNELIPLLEEYKIIYKQNKTCCTIQ